MINKYMKIGILNSDMDEVTKDLQDILNLHFEEHESSYWGDYHVANISEKEKIRLVYNYVDEDWQEEDYKEFLLLLELNRLEEPEKIMKLLCERLTYLKPLYMQEVEARVSTKKYIYQNGGFILVDEY
ncbi:hypothetical protein M3231_18445 [Neobacillus mesonae]|nr:hypothetical protein [Neobacillus mesonae]